MFSESVCQISRRWDDVFSFYACLCGVVYVTRWWLGKRSGKVTTRVHQILCKSWEKCYRNPRNDSTSLRGPNLSRTQVFKGHSRFKARCIKVDDEEHTERLTSCTIPETVARIQEIIRQDRRRVIRDIAGEVDVGMRHANGFWRKNLSCSESRPNFCPGSWQLTGCTSASESALKFVSSPPMMKRSCPRSLLVTRPLFTFTTLRQSDNPPSGNAPRHQDQ